VRDENFTQNFTRILKMLINKGDIEPETGVQFSSPPPNKK
jgi:hypothetical protein